MAPNEDPIEALLRAQRALPVEDDGFTRQLMSRLPPRPRVAHKWMVPGMTLVGGLLAFVAVSGHDDLEATLEHLVRGEHITALVLLPLALIIAGCAWALSESK